MRTSTRATQARPVETSHTCRAGAEERSASHSWSLDAQDLPNAAPTSLSPRQRIMRNAQGVLQRVATTVASSTPECLPLHTIRSVLLLGLELCACKNRGQQSFSGRARREERTEVGRELLERRRGGGDGGPEVGGAEGREGTKVSSQLREGPGRKERTGRSRSRRWRRRWP